MNELAIWNQGHSAGINLAVKMLNEWCDLKCETLIDAIKLINKIQQEKESCSK